MKIDIDNKKPKPLTWRDAKPGDLMITSHLAVLRLTDSSDDAIGVVLDDGTRWIKDQTVFDRIIPGDDLVLSLREGA